MISFNSVNRIFGHLWRPLFRPEPRLFLSAIFLLVAQTGSAKTVVPGIIPGELDVNHGAAGYTIPIEVAGGRKGMEPDLSLQYSSNNGNGVVGLGWRIGGISAITRCGRTFAQDGGASGVKFDNSGRFCLDGQRLVPVDGSSHGRVDGEYRTELDSYAKITSHGGTRNHPDYWIVKTKSGQTMTYGTVGYSKLAFSKGTVSWSLRRIGDQNNKNSIFYEYSIDNKTQYLKKVSYVGGRVEFAYDTDRSDTRSFYVFGSTVKARWRLKKITSFARDKVLKNYTLSYEAGDGMSPARLKEVELCGRNNLCVQPLKFSWTGQGSSDIRSTTWSLPYQIGHYQYMWTGDFNGDGLTDVATGNTGNVYMKLATGNGFDSVAWSVSNQWGGGNYTWSGDFNGDGLMDVASASGGNVFMKLSTGSGFNSKTWTVSASWGGAGYTWTGDFNGDGLTDIASARGDNVYMKLSTGSGFSSKTWKVANNWGGDTYSWAGDFNGDGLTDIASASGGNIYVKLSTGQGFRSETWTVANLWGGAGYTKTGDFNGDGLTDIASIKGGNIYMKFSTGTGFSSQTRTVPNNWGEESFTWASDFNGDGITDIASVRYNTSSLHVHYAKQGGFESKTHTVSSQWGFPGWTWLGDFTGDGLLDLASMGVGSVYMKFTQKRVNTSLAAVTDSQKNTTWITYKPLTNSSVYTKGQVANYPFRDVISAQRVVSQVKASNAQGGRATTNYTYRGLKAHLRGRGMQGFTVISESHPETQKTLTTTYYQHGGTRYQRSNPIDAGYPTAFPFSGLPVKKLESYSGKRVNEWNTSYNSDTEHQGFNNPRLHQLKGHTKTDKSYELDGTLITKVMTKTSEFDFLGNVGKVQVDTYGTHGEKFTKITESTYLNSTVNGNWKLGRLNNSVTRHQAPGKTEKKRRVQFKYTADGLLEEERVVSAADSSNWLKRTRYQYNDTGLKTRTTLSAPGESSRVTTTNYDSVGRVSGICDVYNACTVNTYNDLGLLASTRDANGLVTSWVYDGLGRKIREDRPDGTWSTTRYAFASSGQCVPSGGGLAKNAYSCVINQSKGSPAVYTQLDKLGRTLRTIKTGFDGRLVYSDTQFDSLGRVARVSRDYYPGDYVYWATSEYDALDRIVRATQPGPHGSEHEISTQYYGLTTRTYSGPDSRERTIIKNALGKTIRVEEPLGTSVAYTYTSDGNLRSTVVNGDTDTRILLDYDEFGRKTRSTDPDMGRWHYTYNGFGELISQKNAKGQVMTMKYDRLGRIITRDEPEGRSSWRYGRKNTTPAAPNGSVGKLLEESAPDITKVYSYDTLGRSVAVNTTIAGEGSFIVKSSYDGNGRLRRTTYPGNAFFTENIYNSRGYLSLVRGLRGQAESHNYAALKPLVSKASNVAAEYASQAKKLRSIGKFYASKIAYYRSLSGSGTVKSDVKTQLRDHRSQLESIKQKGKNLSPKFLGHLNQVIKELEAVNRLLSSTARRYTSIANQLSRLAAQTLAAADHNFHYQRTYTTAASEYNNWDKDSKYITYWKALNVDASGRINAEVYGNGIVNDYTYNQGTGHLEVINSSLLVIDPVRHLEYAYDGYDNVTLRDDLVNDIRETYEYDGLDRLTDTHVTSGRYQGSAFNSVQSLRYDDLGNITYKTGVGSYTYGANGAGPHAVTKAGNKSYSYDANGNMTAGAGRQIKWSSYNKATRITKSGRSADFKYGADRARFYKRNHAGDEIYYIDKLYEQVHKKATAVIEKKYNVYAGGQLVAVHLQSSAAGKQTRYLHQDALGSVDLITDAHANVVDRRSFDAWGKMRNLPWKANASLNDPLYITQLPYTNKGYTGHEHIQEVDLIHMNGRIYDSTLGRFISADPHIQSQGMAQAYNRYSYVLNNPMKYTDPSGYFFKRLFRAIKKIFRVVKKFVGIIAAVALSVWCTACSPWIIGALSSAVSAAVNGGNILKAFVTGGLTGWASGFIGGATKIFGARRMFDVGRAMAHGVVGGVVSVIQGGKFGVGFVSSAFTKFVSGPIESFAGKVSEATGIASDIVGVTAAALVGGTASVIGGGSFANGAQTAAVQYLFNQAGERIKQRQALERIRRNNPGVTILTERQLRRYRDPSVGTPGAHVVPGQPNPVSDFNYGTYDLLVDGGRLVAASGMLIVYLGNSAIATVTTPLGTVDYYLPGDTIYELGTAIPPVSPPAEAFATGVQLTGRAVAVSGGFSKYISQAQYQSYKTYRYFVDRLGTGAGN